MYEKELKNLGLSEKEAKIYLTSLELGPETVQNIAKKAGINRPTTYLQIESLKARGLMSQFEKGKKTFYNAESPDRLLSLLNNFEKELEFNKSEVSRILPFLNDLFSGAGERPRVRFFEGLRGKEALQEDFLSVKEKKIESVINLDKLFQAVPKIEEEYTSRRVAKGIKSLVIYTRHNGPLEEATDASKLRKAKFVSGEKMPISSDITIYDDKVALANYNKSKPIGVIIEDKEIADTIRAIFYLIWDQLS